MPGGLDFTAMLEELLDAEEEIANYRRKQAPTSSKSRDLSGSAINLRESGQNNLIPASSIHRENSSNSLKVTFASVDGEAVTEIVEYDKTETVRQLNSETNFSAVERFPSTSSISSQKSILKPPSSKVIPDILPLDPEHQAEFDSDDSLEESNSDGESSDLEQDPGPEESDSDEDNTPLGIRFGSIQSEPEYATFSVLDEYTTDEPCIDKVGEPGSSSLPSSSQNYFKLQENRPVRLINEAHTSIFIEETGKFVTQGLEPSFSVKDVVQELKLLIGESDSWALFERFGQLGVERPLREWEMIKNILDSWGNGPNTNALVVRHYEDQKSLTKGFLRHRYPRIKGNLYMESKPGQWIKRYFYLQDQFMYYYADDDLQLAGPGILLCDFSNFDVYTLTRKMRNEPTPFGFALKSYSFEAENSCIFYLFTERKHRLEDWLKVLRLAKGEHMESVANPLYKPKSNVESASVQSESNGNTEQAPAQNIAMHKGGKVMKMEFKRTHKSESAKEKPRSKREIPLPLVDITTLGNCTKCPCVESIGVDVCPKCGHVHSNKK